MRAVPVADLMREMGLAAVQPRAYKRTTLPGKEPVAAPDLLERKFTAEAPGQRLVGDITYLRTGEGWLYLATVIDLATRMVVGWQLAAHMRTTLVTDALAMAIDAGHVTDNAIFHSDRGTQGGFARSSQRWRDQAASSVATTCAGLCQPGCCASLLEALLTVCRPARENARSCSAW